MSDLAQLSGAELHAVLQVPAVRNVFDEMMQIKAELPHAQGDTYRALSARLKVVSDEWFRLSREAAKTHGKNT